MIRTALRDKLQQIDQAQVLRFADTLTDAQQQRLVSQLQALDLDAIAELADQYVRRKPQVQLPASIKPVQPFPRLPDATRKALYEQSQKRGRALLRAGRIGAFLVAGGQGTRLGYDGPKGEFPATPIKHKPLFQVFAEQLLAYSRDAGRVIPWYIMTSDVNDGPTRRFFQTNNYFGYQPASVFFFQQGMMPAFSLDGKMLLAEPDSLALSPDGHGGSLRAIARSGALADMHKRGVEHLSYFQVDNPLVHCIDPLFLGLHDTTGSEMSSKTIPKAHPLERVGNFVMADGRSIGAAPGTLVLQVIEYSDLPNEMALQKNTDGSLRFNAGSIAIHALRVSFIERLNAGGRLRLPWHRAEKKVVFVDDSGQEVKPQQPNAVKLEQFVFDAIPLAKQPIVYTTERSEEFSPVKNAEGDDSPATSRRDQVRRAARWLQEAGIYVPMREGEPDCTLEISPLYATSAEQLRSRAPKVQLHPGDQVYFGPDGPEKL